MIYPDSPDFIAPRTPRTATTETFATIIRMGENAVFPCELPFSGADRCRLAVVLVGASHEPSQRTIETVSPLVTFPESRIRRVCLYAADRLRAGEREAGPSHAKLDPEAGTRAPRPRHPRLGSGSDRRTAGPAAPARPIGERLEGIEEPNP